MTTEEERDQLRLRIIRVLLDNNGFQSVPSITCLLHGGVYREIQRVCDEMVEAGLLRRGKAKSKKQGATNKVRAYKVLPEQRSALYKIMQRAVTDLADISPHYVSHSHSPGQPPTGIWYLDRCSVCGAEPRRKCDCVGRRIRVQQMGAMETTVRRIDEVLDDQA